MSDNWVLEKWDYSEPSPQRDELFKRLSKLTVVLVNYEKDSVIILGDDNQDTAQEARLILAALNTLTTG